MARKYRIDTPLEYLLAKTKKKVNIAKKLLAEKQSANDYYGEKSAQAVQRFYEAQYNEWQILATLASQDKYHPVLDVLVADNEHLQPVLVQAEKDLGRLKNK